MQWFLMLPENFLVTKPRNWFWPIVKSVAFMPSYALFLRPKLHPKVFPN